MNTSGSITATVTPGGTRGARLNVGLIGLGRLGRIYARDLSGRVPRARLAAVADRDAGLAERIADDFDVPRWYGDPRAVIDDPSVDAVVIVTPTNTHRDLVVAALERGKPVFCEKPPALSIAEVTDMKRAIVGTGGFFQMGFMRRFDPGYAAAYDQIQQGRIGRPVVFKSSSRDPFLPSLEYADPRSSGGLFVDMGIHDFDLARWLVDEVASVHALGAVLQCPELRPLGDIDNGIVSLTFADGRLGVVDLSRKGVYGYDIRTEILGTEGAVQVGYLRETPLLVLGKEGVSHDVVPYFMERFERSYVAQLANFAANVVDGSAPPVTIDDGLEALRISLAATMACQSGRTVHLSEIALS
jgi:scyllo-inositol 2-dehydrogenase (NAD+)